MFMFSKKRKTGKQQTKKTNKNLDWKCIKSFKKHPIKSYLKNNN